MDGLLRRATPIALLGLAGLAWFERLMPGHEAIEQALGRDAVLRFVIGVLCLYMLLLVLERQRMAAEFKQVLRAFRDFHTGKGSAAASLDSQREAVQILIGALESGDAEVVDSARVHLERLTGASLGTDPSAWRAWLERQ